MYFCNPSFSNGTLHIISSEIRVRIHTKTGFIKQPLVSHKTQSE